MSMKCCLGSMCLRRLVGWLVENGQRDIGGKFHEFDLKSPLGFGGDRLRSRL